MNRLVLLLALALLSACRTTSDPTQALGAETRIVFEGVHALSEDDLLKAIDADRYGEAPERATRAMVDDAAYAVEELYRGDGYAEVAVEYELREAEAESTALFHIEEGPRLMLTAVAFQGNDGIDSETLARLFLPDGEPRPFVHAWLSSAASGIEGYYYRNGWLRARVEDMSPAIDVDAGSVRVACAIAEGPQFLLRSVRSESAPGSEPIDPEIRAELDDAIAPNLDRPFVPGVGFALRAALIESYGRRGYPDAAAPFEASRNEDNGDVDLVFTVTPGSQVKIGAVHVQGTEDVRAALVLDRLTLSEGDLYDTTKIRKSFANLYRSGLFRSVRIDLEEVQGTVRDLIVTIEEQPSLEFFIEPGYGSYEGPKLSLGVDERNFLGTGTGLRAEGTVGALDQGTSLAWTDPWIAAGRYESRVSIYAESREEPSFTEDTYGTEWSLTRVWSQRVRSTVTYNIRRSDLQDIDLDKNDPLLEDALEDVDIGSISLSTTSDDRSGLFAPRSGGRQRASIQLATGELGSEVNFLGGNMEASHFFELSSDTVLAVRLGIGLKGPIGDTDTLPIQERLYNGGENTVRSFKQDELGPLDSGGDPVGGEAYNVFNVELRRHLVGNLHGALFYDAGNVSSEVEDYFDFDDIGNGLGLGVRYELPIGPVRLDVAWNPDARDDEDDFVAHFAIGMAF